MCEEIDAIRLNFSEGSLILLDFTLAFIMFGVALNLRWEDFQRVIAKPKIPLVGVASQFLFLPALTWVLVNLLEPCPSMALGMFLVAACPGGNVSNFLALLSKANVALSVSLTAIATVLSIFMTPLNFTFWASLYPPAAQMLYEDIDMDPVSIFIKVLLVLGLPLALGMWTASKLPKFTSKALKPVQVLSLLIFGGYVVAAIAGNWEFILKYVPYVIGIVFLHNALALLTGYTSGFLVGAPLRDRRSISIETGIQNSGVALVLVFGTLFDGLGGMALIAALWGVWHLVVGISLATIWSRRVPAMTTES
ncbi:MAG: bile acid:sodium symporter family protein [Bacteroidota bacterium]